MPWVNPGPGEITTLWSRWKQGDGAALDSLAALAYDQLHTIAAGYLRHESRGHTLQATGLVNEIYLRLASQRKLQLTDRRHSFTFAALLMRRILVDYARRSQASKRPGTSVRVPLHPGLAWVDASGDDVLMLDQALQELEVPDERKVRVVDFRFFPGCGNEETAELLGVTRATVDRDLQCAKTWLYRRLQPQLPAASKGN